MTKHNESGATLILVIGFLVIIGLLSGAVVTLLLTGASTRGPLDSARNREYAADGAVEHAIADVRAYMPAHPQVTQADLTGPCPFASHAYPANDLPNEAGSSGTDIQVDCTYKQRFTFSGYVQRNVLFVACEPQAASAPCGNAAIITAQVNYQSTDPVDAPRITVGNVLVQSWSVNQ